MRGTNFANLRAFMAIVESGSFSKAAKSLGVSPSTLSYTIQSLEQRFGLRLLNRTTRRVVPTEAGARIARRFAPLLSEFDSLISELSASGDRPSGTLKICVPRMPMQLYVEAMLDGFEAAYPDITIDLTIGDLFGDLAASDYDAAVFASHQLTNGLVAISLTGPLDRITYASSGYVAHFGMPAHPLDLKQHNCIVWRGPVSGKLYDWEFRRGDDYVKFTPKGSLIVSDTSFALSAALNGKGIGYGIEQISRRYIEEGRLIALLPEWSTPHPGYSLAYPGNRRDSAVLKAFVSYIRRRQHADR